MQVGAKSIGSSLIYVDSLVLAEPGVVASDLSAGGVQGSTEASPEGNQVGSHVPAASGVNHPQTGVSLVGLLVEALVLRHLVLGVDHAHFGGGLKTLAGLLFEIGRAHV